MSHLPPLRFDVGILILLLIVAGLVLAVVRNRRGRRRRPHGIRVDLVGNGNGESGGSH